MSLVEITETALGSDLKEDIARFTKLVIFESLKDGKPKTFDEVVNFVCSNSGASEEYVGRMLETMPGQFNYNRIARGCDKPNITGTISYIGNRGKYFFVRDA